MDVIKLWGIIFIIIFVLKNIRKIINIVNECREFKTYKESTYYQATGLKYRSVIRDKGRYGEYLTYKYLKEYETSGARFLFNVYVPKEDGETTEIDVLMIHTKGVFVFESKNYSGWIFGSEGQKNWYQTLPVGGGLSNKEHFYNPVIQNREHIKHLITYIGKQIPTWSIVTFSNRCTLKNVNIKSSDIKVVNRYDVATAVSDIYNKVSEEVLNTQEVEEIYNKLYPCTQVDASVKAQHIINIHNKPNSQSVQPVTPVEPIDAQEQPKEVSNDETDTLESKVEATEDISIEVFNVESDEQNTEESHNPKCPRCGGNLVLRIATRGEKKGNQFYGCDNYPRCRYIQNVENEKVKSVE